MRIEKQRFLITTTKKVIKSIEKLPIPVQKRFQTLVDQLARYGPIAHKWPNYSKLEKNKYHCHLKYHYVACWSYENGTIQIEVYYVGSREKAPY